MSDLIIIGGSGHAEVLADIALKNGYTIAGFLDDNEKTTEVLGFKVLGKVSDCLKYKNDCKFVIGIGNNAIRQRIAEEYSELNFVTLIHPTASIGLNATIAEGTVVMPMAVINACATIGKQTIINSGAVIEHDCLVGDYCLIAPHATLCGVVKISNNVHIGAGSVVNQTLSVCDNVIVGSGSVITKNITEPGTYVGIPAKKL